MCKQLKSMSVAAFILVFLTGAFLRLWMLGHAAFPADEMNFYNLALRNQSIVEFWRNPPWLNHIPLNETFTLLLVKAGLPPTSFVTRLPFAIMGILTLFLLWRFAKKRFGDGTAFCVLVLAALNPFQLYYARTAYYYAGALCWSTAMFMVFWKICEYLAARNRPPARLLALWTIVAALACHMHMSVWAVAGLQGLLMLISGVWALRADRQACRHFILLLCGVGVLLGVVMSRWVYRALLEMQKVKSAGGHLGNPISGVLQRLFPAFFAGENWIAIALLAAFFVIALVALYMAYKRKTEFAFFSLMAGIHVIFLMLYIGLAGSGLAKVVYFSTIWPLFIWFMGAGLWQGAAVLSAGRRRMQYGMVAVFLGAYTILTLPSALAIVNLEGKLMPTFKVNDWVLQNLPTGTPVLVDRWFHPWNELAIHNADQINYTFTVPDEPVENYVALKWRDTAAAFFEKYPQAALLEVNPGKYQDKVGPWHFPEQHFSRIASITNQPAVMLQKYCTYPFGRSTLKDEKKEYLRRIFYNTIEDLIAAAKRKNQTVLRLYGDGWRFVKPWQPMQGWPEQVMQLLWIQAGMYEAGGKTVTEVADLQKLPRQQAMQYLNRGRWADYRIPASHSVLQLFNLTEKEMPATLMVTGIALSGNVRCMIGDEMVLFPQTLMTERRLPVTLKPGENKLVVTISKNQFMLIHDIRLTAADAQ